MGCQLLCRALETSPNQIKVVAQAIKGRDILTALTRQKPQVALISSSLEEGPQAGFSVMQEVYGTFPHARPIMLLENSEPEAVTSAFRAGAKGVFCRNGTVEALCKCISCVHQGQIWATSTELQFVLEHLSRTAPFRTLNGNGDGVLTKREKEVVGLVVEGLNNDDIATQLKLSRHTIKNYLFRIFDKLGISNRVELVLYVLHERNAPAMKTPTP